MLAEFREWIGKDKTFLCTWGDDDRRQIIKHCKRYELDLLWFCNYNNIQLQISALQGKENGQLAGLTNALKDSNIRFLGTPHHALDDAFNTAKLFRHFFKKLKLVEQEFVDEPVVLSKIVYGKKREPNLAIAQFAHMFDDLFSQVSTE
jgi:inhibitor of KinA sporulation pathway (predicted exonuclease)